MPTLSDKLAEKLRRVKLVATDLDGTLLDNRGEISDVTRQGVQKLTEIGINLAIMTGRAHLSAERIADKLGLRTPIISLDGALVRLPHAEANIFASYVKPSTIKDVMEEADKSLTSVALLADDRLVRLESAATLPSYIGSLDLESEIVEDLFPYVDRTVRIIAGGDSHEAVKAIERVALSFFSKLEASFYRSSSHEGRWYLEIRNRNCSKATGLAHLEKYYGISKREVAVLGDFRNDIEAFKRAGTGIAMKNAVPELKDQADLVTESSNDGDGAAEFLELFYEVRKNDRY